MEIEVETLENGNVQFTVHNESHTLLNPIVDILLKRPDVSFASYRHVHPLKDISVLLLRLNSKARKGTTELDVLMEAVGSLKNELKETRQQIDTTFE
jgi:DNA-directed RNA polymerase subunit L